MSREHPMTKYDAGQNLIACADLLSEKEKDLKDGGFIEEAITVNYARHVIGEIFNKLHEESHGFGLPSIATTPVIRGVDGRD